MSPITEIPKEVIPQLHFYKQDVLHNESQKKERLNLLMRAERLGNAYHGKVKITFMEDNQEVHMVETTVWATFSDYIVLKGGISIPVNAIMSVAF